MIDPLDLVTAKTISERLGVTHSTVVRWNTPNSQWYQASFPPPVPAPYIHFRIWEWPKVRKWAASTGRLPR